MFKNISMKEYYKYFLWYNGTFLGRILVLVNWGIMRIRPKFWCIAGGIHRFQSMALKVREVLYIIKLRNSTWNFSGAFYEPGQKTVIPRKVTGKFSIRIVPNQTPEQVEKCVVNYLNKKWEKRGSPNKMKVRSLLPHLSL